ncbi:MAG: isocyanide synthase family protein [Actinomycetota bacterium]|nr:isocyanide synthase family protein [Actinomycetota bacterium]
MSALVQADVDEIDAFRQRYRAPSVEEIDPSFIHMNPAVMKRSDFEPLEDYNEPVEPRVIEGFDYEEQAQLTVDTAEDFVSTIRNRLDRLPTVYDKVFDVMRSKRFRAGTASQTRFDENKELFRPIVEAQIADGAPLEFVLPSFPFKHNNPVKVSRRSPDMAEVLCLCRLREICQALGRIYEPGARFVIISDGLVYHDMFGVTRHEALSYRERTREMIGQLGFQDTIEVTDMEQLVRSRQVLFDFVHDRVAPVFREWWDTNSEDLRRASLIQASAANLNTADSVTHDLVQMATKDVLLDSDEGDDLSTLVAIKSQTVQRAEKGAFEFALFLYILREIDLVQSCYPRAVRATVHPKPTQWGLHLANRESRVFPWQGVAYRNEHGRWRVKYEFEVTRARATPVHVRGEDEMFAFYYEHSDHPRAR